MFQQDRDREYLWVGAESKFDLSAAGSGSASYKAIGLPGSATLDPATGGLTWNPESRDRTYDCPRCPGARSVQVVADDGKTVAARTFEFVVAPNRPKLIDALLKDHFDLEAAYTTVSRELFQAALKDAKVASESGADEGFRTAFEKLRDEVEALELLNPRLADGALDFSGTVTPSGIPAAGVNNLVDGGKHSHSGDLRVGSFVLDFGTRYRVEAEQFGFRARFSFPMRSQGTNVYGSNDGIAWTKLSERTSGDTNDLETIDVVEDQRGKKYRYVKLQVDEPGIPIDPAGPGIWSISEFRIFGDRSEVPGTVSDVSLTSADALRERVTPGDTAKLTFSSTKPISEVSVTIAGKAVEAVSEDGLSWTASAGLAESQPTGPVPISIDYTTEDGKAAATVAGTTDFTALYYSDDHKLVDVGGTAEVINPAGEPDPGNVPHSKAVFDGNVGTFSDVPDVDSESSLIWDFGPGASVSVDRIDFLARQDERQLARWKAWSSKGRTT
ncbi:discoidin domain-containing protein [Microlunatus sp. GCM10028923]|uniref:discoidin domain-containing protein n=1 Tax=Microlunatus sp. GCM10028923 TaxID=3273400 RepID=UPI0036231B86